MLLEKGNHACAEPFFGRVQKMLVDMVFTRTKRSGNAGT